MELSYSPKPTGCNVVILRLDMVSSLSERAKGGDKLRLQHQPKKRGNSWMGRDKKDYAYQEIWTLSGHEKVFSSPGYIPTTFWKDIPEKGPKTVIPVWKKKMQILKVNIKILGLPVKKSQQSIQLIPQQLWKTSKQKSLSYILACECS